jgi:hypothetical protein
MEWIKFEKNDKRFENHVSYIVTDGIIVSDAYWDTGEFVGCEDSIRDITHWMNWPEPPKE